MRLLVVILAAVGALVLCLAAVIGAGVSRLSWLSQAPPAPATKPVDPAGAAPTVPMASEAAEADEAPPESPQEIVLTASAAKVIEGEVELVNPSFGRPGGGVGFFPGPRRGGRFRVPPPPVLSHWNNPAGAVEWTFTVPKAGRYAVSVVYTAPGTGDEAQGSFVLSVGGSTLSTPIRPTGRSRAAGMADAGTFDLPQGEVTLRLRPGEGSASPLLGIRSVKLYRAE